jgi:formylglycine-generating enzyme required for sulfatase activity
VAWQEIPGAPVPRGHCLRFAEPVTCFDDRRKPMHYCMDRYEWPNRRGEKPRTLTSWQDARATCAAAGKRLCTEEEWNFACEGEEMRAYVYGNARDPDQCNFDRPYRPRAFVFTAWDACQADPACKEAFDAIDQRLPAGSLETCRSKQGIYDLIGNANEWVMIPDKRTPHRSGIKGGWWGPVRARCRPTVTFHDEGDFGYEVGFRCCADAR